MPIRIWCMKEHIPKESGKRWAGHGYLDHVPVGSLKIEQSIQRAWFGPRSFGL